MVCFQFDEKSMLLFVGDTLEGMKSIAKVISSLFMLGTLPISLIHKNVLHQEKCGLTCCGLLGVSLVPVFTWVCPPRSMKKLQRVLRRCRPCTEGKE